MCPFLITSLGIEPMKLPWSEGQKTMGKAKPCVSTKFFVEQLEHQSAATVAMVVRWPQSLLVKTEL